MAITLTDNRDVIDHADSLTGWTGHDTLVTTNPTPVEAGGCLGHSVGAEVFASYFTQTVDDMSDAVVYCWVFSRLSLGDTADANGGLMILLGDATPDRIGYKVNGADKAAFRHDTGPTGWQCAALDTQSLPASPYVDAGVAVNIDLTAIVDVGTIVNSLTAAPGMNATFQSDIMRFLDVPKAGIDGCAADITGGASGGTEGTWAEIATADQLVGDLQAHGLVRELAAGAFGVQGPLRFGNATGTAASWFEDSNVTVVFEDRGFRTDLYKIFITDNGTGTTTFRLHASALIAPTGVGAEFDADTDTDVTDVVIDTGSRIAGFLGGVGLQVGHIVTDTVITGSGQVRANGATMNGSSVLQSTVVANDSALQWNVNTDPDGLLDNMTFDKTAATAHHAIEFGTAIATAADFTLTGCDFGTDFSATEEGVVGDETFHFLDTTGTITLNLVGCTGNFGFRTEGVTVTIVADPVTVQVTATEKDGTVVESARVFLQASDGTGPFPFEDAITSITRLAAEATVTTTGVHGMATGDKIYIEGITDKIEDNYTVLTVTVLTTTTFTFVTTNAGSTAYTGTMTCTFVALNDVTNVSGIASTTRVYPSNQPVTGWSRKSTAAPYLQEGVVIGIIDSANGIAGTAVMLTDQ